MPQLFMLTKTGNAETITAHYLFALGLYRALYIVNWIYRYTEGNSGCDPTNNFIKYIIFIVFVYILKTTSKDELNN